MKLHFAKPLMTTLLLVTAACGGGAGEDDDPIVPGNDPTPGSNGLDYAVSQNLRDAEGNAMTLTSASFESGAGASAQSGSITLDAGFLSGGALSGSVDVLGETVAITNGTGNLANGQDVTLVYEAGRSGDYVGAVELVAFETGGAVAGETHYVFGFETDPAEITSGTATYSGGFQASGLLNGTTEAEYEGDAIFDVNFAGRVEGAFDGRLNNTTDVDLTLGQTSFGGNSFEGDLSCASGCSGAAGSVGGTFYGPNAEELGGVLALEFGNFEGAGTLILTVD